MENLWCFGLALMPLNGLLMVKLGPRLLKKIGLDVRGSNIEADSSIYIDPKAKLP